MSTRKLCIQNNYSLTAIGNMVNTPLWICMSGDTNIARTGDESISLLTSGNDLLCV